MKYFMFFISVILHPLFISIYATFFYFNRIDKYYHTKNIDQSSVFMNIIGATIVAPLIIFFILYSFKKVRSLLMGSAKERIIPLAFNCIIIGVLLYRLNSENVPELILFFIGCLISTVLALVYSIIKVKVSLHMIGITSLACFICILGILPATNYMAIIIALCCIILVALSRTKLKAHTPKELIQGFLIGLLTQVTVFSLF